MQAWHNAYHSYSYVNNSRCTDWLVILFESHLYLFCFSVVMVSDVPICCVLVDGLTLVLRHLSVVGNFLIPYLFLFVVSDFSLFFQILC